MMKEVFSVIAVLSVFFSSCLGPSKQQAYLEDLSRKDTEISKFSLKTGRSGSTAYLDVRGMQRGANPAASVRAFLLVADQYKDEALEGFELRFRGKTRFYFQQSDLKAISAQYTQQDGTLTVMRETLRAARSSNRSPASEALTSQKPNSPPAEVLQLVTQEMQRFLRSWFLDDLARTGAVPAPTALSNSP